MPLIHVTTRAGGTIDLNAPADGTLMELLRDNSIDGIEAMCGGCCSCATCHVHVGHGYEAHIPARSSDEEMLLSGVSEFTDESRLSCQIQLTEDLDGLRVAIPTEL